MRKSIAVVGALGCLAGSAAAAPILSFGFTEVSGSYNTDTSAFSAVAVDNGDLSTTGDVSRLVGPGGTANYDPGFAATSPFGDVALNMTVTPIDALSASGAGHITITDDDGDTLEADVNGVFTDGGAGLYFFTGTLSNAVLTGTTFDGPNGGSFDMDLPGDGPYTGALVQLFLDTDGGFFNHDFDGVSVELNGELVPTPGSLALLGSAGLIAIRRRRA